jgi:hypothetical protein
MSMNMMPKLVSQDGFDFIRGIVLKQRVGENDAARIS